MRRASISGARSPATSACGAWTPCESSGRWRPSFSGRQGDPGVAARAASIERKVACTPRNIHRKDAARRWSANVSGVNAVSVDANAIVSSSARDG